MEPIGGGVEVNHVQLERSTIEASPDVDADDGVFQIGRDDHLKDSRWIGDRALKVFQKHEFIEGIVPLHEKYAVGSCTAQILVAVVGVTADAAFTATLCVVHLQYSDWYYICLYVRPRFSMIIADPDLN